MDCSIELHKKVEKGVEKQIRGFSVHKRRRRKATAQIPGQLPPEYKLQGAAIRSNNYNEINLYGVPKQPGKSQVMWANG